MFCLIWLLGGGGIGDPEVADEGGCECLDEEDEWLEEGEETLGDVTLEDEEE